ALFEPDHLEAARRAGGARLPHGGRLGGRLGGRTRFTKHGSTPFGRRVKRDTHETPPGPTDRAPGDPVQANAPGFPATRSSEEGARSRGERMTRGRSRRSDTLGQSARPSAKVWKSQ